MQSISPSSIQLVTNINISVTVSPSWNWHDRFQDQMTTIIPKIRIREEDSRRALSTGEEEENDASSLVMA
jgi:hypothetical protein